MVDHERLVDELTHAVEAIVSLAEESGLGTALPTYEYDVHWLEPERTGQSSGKLETREEPSWHLLIRQLDAQINEQPAVRSLKRSIQEFVDREGEFLPRVGGIGPPECVSTLLECYFGRVAELRTDVPTIEQVCSEFESDLKSRTAVCRSLYLLERFASSSEFSLDEAVKIRRITEDDIDTFGRVGPSFMRRRLPWLNASAWVCEIRETRRKDSVRVPVDHDDVIDAISVALSLTMSGHAALTLLESRVESPFLSAVRSGSSNLIRTGAMGGFIELDDSDIEKVISHYALAKRVLADSRYSHLDLPFRRLRLAASRREPQDVLVDYVIGLERLLASDGPVEATFRFRLRGAALLPDSFGDPRKRIKLMSDIYGLRSEIVHGEAKAKEVSDMVPQVEEVFRAIFLWYFNHAESLGNAKGIQQALDDVMVQQAQTWAQSAGSADEAGTPNHKD